MAEKSKRETKILKLNKKLKDKQNLLYISENTLISIKTEGRRRRGRQRTRCLDGITDSMDMSLHKLWELVDVQRSLVCCSPWGCKEVDMTEQLN